MWCVGAAPWLHRHAATAPIKINGNSRLVALPNPSAVSLRFACWAQPSHQTHALALLVQQ